MWEWFDAMQRKLFPERFQRQQEHQSRLQQSADELPELLRHEREQDQRLLLLNRLMDLRRFERRGRDSR